MTGVDFNEPPWDVEEGLGRYSKSWNAFHASPHARAQENLLKWGVKGLNAAVLAGGGTILSHMTYKRLRGGDPANVTPQKQVLEQMPNGDLVEMSVAGGGPAPATVKTVKRHYRLDLSDSFGAPTVQRIIGDPDLVPEHGRVTFPSANGWKYNLRHYLDVRRMFTPFRYMVGDCLSTVATTTTIPTHIDAGSFGTTTDHFARWYNTDYATVLKSKATRNACLEVTGKYSNMTTDFCIPICPVTAHGELQVGAYSTRTDFHPIGALDIFGDFATGSTTTGGINDAYVYTMGGGPFAMNYGGAAPTPFLGNHSYENDYDNRCAYLNLETEFKLFNPTQKTLTFELYQCLPKKATTHSPLYDVQLCAVNGVEEHNSYTGSADGWMSGGRSPLEYKAFRQLWKLRRKTIVVVPGSVVSVKMRLRNSLISRSMLKRILDGETFASAPGLTQWLWIRAKGAYGGDVATGVMGHEEAKFWIQMFQKAHIVSGYPMVKKTIDVRDYPVETTITIDELVGQDDQKD